MPAITNLAELARIAESTLGLTPRGNQLKGAKLLAAGHTLVELATGEGKTLMAALAAASMVGSGRRVHVHTHNEYLARRDPQWLAAFYRKLGISVSSLQPDYTLEQRKKAYSADIVYGAPSQFCFDYLRDNMATDAALTVGPQGGRGMLAAIVDEADAVMLDLGRVPFSITQPVAASSPFYHDAGVFAAGLAGVHVEETVVKPSLVRGFGPKPVAPVLDADYVFDPGNRTTWLLERGYVKMEQYLADTNNTGKEISFNQAVVATLRARFFQRDVLYLVRDGVIIHIDESTGRPVPGRTLGDGVQQALEAREGLPLSPESIVLASITLQDYLAQYGRLSGMTGTAWADRGEFEDLYHLDVRRLKPHRPCIRIDEPDRVFGSMAEKHAAILADIQRSHAAGQPVLVGASSITEADLLYAALTNTGLPVSLLTAKDFEGEDAVLEMAGAPGAITITANMAGRGADIVLGGKGAISASFESVTNVGGLRVIGTERSTLSRVDLQLRGRSGRQGQPGSSAFYVSLDDELFKGVPRTKVQPLLALAAGMPLLDKLVAHMVRSLQGRSNGADSTARVALVRAEETMRTARSAYYAWRKQVLMDPGYAADLLPGLDLPGEVKVLLEEADAAWHSWLVDADIRKRGAWMKAPLGRAGQWELTSDAFDRFSGYFQDALARTSARLHPDPSTAAPMRVWPIAPSTLLYPSVKLPK